MKRKVTYTAADQKNGFTAQELRDALRHATALGPATMRGWRRRLVAIEVEESIDPGVKIGLS
jgi:hypothetical protein